VADAKFEFGGGHPDPSSFPYEGMVEATADVMKAEGAPALSYGEAQGYKGLRDLVVQKYRLFENLDVSPDDVIVSNGSGHALSLAFSAFVDVGDSILSEAPTFSGTLATIRRHGARVLDVPMDAEGMVTSGARALNSGARQAVQAHLAPSSISRTPPGRPQRAAAAGADRAGAEYDGHPRG
jgi:DNA-binding transcriptional MocR family regulator